MAVSVAGLWKSHVHPMEMQMKFWARAGPVDVSSLCTVPCVCVVWYIVLCPLNTVQWWGVSWWAQVQSNLLCDQWMRSCRSIWRAKKDPIAIGELELNCLDSSAHILPSVVCKDGNFIQLVTKSSWVLEYLMSDLLPLSLKGIRSISLSFLHHNVFLAGEREREREREREKQSGLYSTEWQLHP